VSSIKIDNQTLEKLEKLSSLSIDDKNKQSVKDALEEVLDFVDNLNSIDISQVDATFTTLEGGTKLREDVVSNSNMSNKILSNAPQNDESYFIVPKIIE